MEVLLQLCAVLAAALVCLLSGSLSVSCIALSVCIFCLIGISAVFRLMMRQRIQTLISYLMHVQDSLELPDLTKCREDSLGILHSEIYKLVVLLNEQSQEASKGRRYLSDMLSNISHQLKTPLAGITLLADLLKNPSLPAEKRAEFAEKINSQADRASWLIRNLLALSQLEAGVLKLKPESVPPGRLLCDAVKPFEVMAELKGVHLELSAWEGTPVICDRQWTVEALSNIVKNCLEHTPSGGTVTASLEQNNFSTNFVIRDNGEGIKKEQIPYIFDRFYKADNAAFSSVGIGLSMAKQIFLLQNGDITVSSKEGYGTSFLAKIYTH